MFQTFARARNCALAVCFAISLAACANPYEQFYKDLSGGHSLGFQQPKGEPTVSYASSDITADVNRMFENGYGIIGVAAFVAPQKGEDMAIAQAKKVGASHVLLTSKYQSTASGAMPLTTPTTTTTYHSGTASAYGSGGYASGMYSGTSTTYGTQTTYIPYSVDRYEQAGYFFAPLSRTGLGVRIQPLRDEDRQQLQSNKGMRIEAVRKGSPAFLADVLPGDILVSIDGKPTYDTESMVAAIGDAKGREVDYVLFRQSAFVTKKILVPAGTW